MDITAELLRRRHHLPHWQYGGRVYFITFRCVRGALPPAALNEVRQCILFDHGRRYDLLFAVIMPDHVHLLLHPREKSPGLWFDLAKVLQGLKGTSARRINERLGTRGAVWQAESFDRIVRDARELEETWRYMVNNPVRAGLVRCAEDYAFFVKPE